MQAILVTTESDFLYYSGFMSQVILLFAIVHVTGSKILIVISSYIYSK